jgi:excisionase family DNA binding protein
MFKNGGLAHQYYEGVQIFTFLHTSTYSELELKLTPLQIPVKGFAQNIFPVVYEVEMKTLTLNEVARRLGISSPTAKKLGLPGVRLGKFIRYPEESLEAYLRAHSCHPVERPGD